MFKTRALSRIHTVRADKLTKKQKQLDVNGDGEIDAEDLRRLRKGEKPSFAENITTAAKRKTLTEQVAIKNLTINPF